MTILRGKRLFARSVGIREGKRVHTHHATRERSWRVLSRSRHLPCG